MTKQRPDYSRASAVRPPSSTNAIESGSHDAPGARRELEVVVARSVPQYAEHVTQRTSHGGLVSTVVIGYDVGVTIRRITACGRKWAWRVRPDGPSYPGHVLVRIWPRGAGGDAARLDVRVRFDDPWLNFGPIVSVPAAKVAEVFQLAPVTPRLVADAIAQALARHWDPDARGTTTTWAWRDGALAYR